MKNRISEDDIKNFSSVYSKLNSLRDDYHVGKTNRKKVAQEIAKVIKELNDMMIDFSIDLQKDKVVCDLTDVISDYYVAFNLLMELANGSDKYELKCFDIDPATEYERVRYDRHGQKEGYIWAIGEKEALNKIEEIGSSHYYKLEFTVLLKEGSSLVFITDENNYAAVLPYDDKSSGFNKRQFMAKNQYCPIMCYTYNDELGLAVNKLSSYIDVYGGDIDNLLIEDLVNRINEVAMDKSISSEESERLPDSHSRQKKLDRIDGKKRM
jgi:hypothetical protein